ncbi:8-amino-7-oxononanoate synthase [Luteipulveratus mongoliensis]|uniref:8-amino-7-oxononanoate synthase n=1 Tax=Luteipulveratus mongoliensis TaxID=571913 RepID=UPI0009F91424|nr:8-amino-7-oxononanoate synthase [Luteipulveratus mongoliensis]
MTYGPSVLARVAELASLREASGLVRQANPPAAAPRIDLATNDYLGLSRHPDVLEAAARATRDYGTGARASRVARGTHPVHAATERALTELTGQESALLFSSGYLANLAAVTSLADSDTLIVSDQHVHASLIDGARLARGTVAVFPHQDVDAAATLLRNRIQPRAIVVAESIYSVLGDSAPLADLAEACRTYDALLIVDEAHGLGVAGAGRGMVHTLGLAGDPYVVMTATLSKALGAQGGVVLGSPMLRGHLVNTARSFIFDTALAPAAAAAAGRAAELVLGDPAMAPGVGRVAEVLCARLRAHGRDLEALHDLQPTAGAVQSVLMPSADTAAEVAARLAADGIDVGCFRPPSVPDGISRLRLTARATVTEAAADEAAARLTHHLRTSVGRVDGALAESYRDPVSSAPGLDTDSASASPYSTSGWGRDA